MAKQDIHDLLSPHYQVLTRLAQVSVQSFLSTSDIEAYQYRHYKSLVKKKKKQRRTENPNSDNYLQHLRHLSLEAEDK